MSSSSSNPQWIYDVFVNFRGKDTRSSFVSHLDAALSNAGINTFVDHQLHKGTEVGPELARAIEGSHISIVVFSKSYAESSWCLHELEKIMECRSTHGQLVMPIFYDVDPSVVRNQKGAFGKALKATAEKRFLGGEVMENVLYSWSSRLTQAANLSGWDLTNCGSEAELLKKIVEEVLTKLDSAILSITEFPVGLESRVQKVIKFIENGSGKDCMIGIWGMGGSGKTTLAKAIYNQIYRKFVDRSFIENIREACEKDNRGIIQLQEQLLSDFLKTKEKIHSITMGETVIQKRLRGKRALVVLDDVTKYDQFKVLCGNRKLFGLESVLIVTTRDVHLLNLLKVDHVCEMKEMDINESLELFSWHAFKESSPGVDFRQLSIDVVTYCQGLPLALEVLGCHLFKRTKQEWKSALSRLKRIPDDQVQEKLRISYDGLKNDEEKDIFLDICCFFIGKDRANVMEILNACGLYADIGIAVLIDQSLLKVEKNNKLQMHDLLRDMGREIVRKSSIEEPGKRSRLWFYEDIHDVLTKNTGTKTVKGLTLNLQRKDKVSFSTNAFKEMKKLRLLQLDRVDLTGDYGYLSKQLRWVYWKGFAFKCIPDDFYLGNVVVMNLKYSNIKQVWKETKLLEKLKILNLSHSRYLESTPDFSELPNLEKLIMKDCPSLSEVHLSIGDLKNILLINLKDCTSLNNLPRKIYQLKSLKTLILFGCLKIDKLEEDIVQMESLTTLIAKDTAIKEVPYSIVRSKSIGYISLCGYEGLSCDVFPFLIWSWMSPTMNSLPPISPFEGMSLSLVSLDIESDNFGDLSPMLSSLAKLRSVWVQCRSEGQLTQELRKFLDDLYHVDFTKLETSSHASQISDPSLRSLLIEMGSCQIVIDTLGKSISQGLTTNESSDFFLPGGNYPSWLAYTGEGHSVPFQVPEDSDCCVTGIALCVLYSSTPENMAIECFTSVLIINYTKCCIQMYKQDTLMSFNDEDWKGVTSNLGSGDNVEIFVALGHGFTVKKIAVYLVYGQPDEVNVQPSQNVEMELSPEADMQPSLDVEMESSPKEDMQSSPNVKMETSTNVNVQPSPDVEMELSPEVDMQPSPDVEMEPSPKEDMQSSPNVKMEASTNVKMNPSPEVNAQPSPNLKMVPSSKPNKSIFTRLAKRMVTCLCLNQHRGFNNF